MDTRIQWTGVMPAITTPFQEDGSIDMGFLVRHAAWMLDAGCTAIITPGSLGEGNALTDAERVAIWRALVDALGSSAPVIAAIGSASTAGAVVLAREAEASGCAGLMVLPPYLHKGPWEETRLHISAVLSASELDCMLYNNPGAYGVDISPSQITELCEVHRNLRATKDSSGAVNRMPALRSALGDRAAILVGFDDMVLSGVAAGACGWVAGLVNALPKESVRLFQLAQEGESGAAGALNDWFMPLLKMDTVPEFVQLIKLVQSEVGMGSERVRPPRYPISGVPRQEALALIRAALQARL